MNQTLKITEKILDDNKDTQKIFQVASKVLKENQNQDLKKALQRERERERESKIKKIKRLLKLEKEK